MQTKTQKIDIVKELKDRFERKKIAIITSFRGTSVGKSQELRKTLKKDNAEYKVAKKTLLDRALAETGSELKTREFEGEVGIAFGYGDEIAPAKALFKFSKKNETFKILGGILDTTILSAKDVIALAKLPPRDVLLAQVVGTLQAPIRGLAIVLQANIKNLVGVLQNIKDKK